MSQRIRSLTPKACPACGTVGQLARVENQIVCQQCGYTPSAAPSLSPFTAPISSADETPPAKRAAPEPAQKLTSELKKIKPRPKPQAAPPPAAAHPQSPVVPPAEQAAEPQKSGFTLPDPASPYSAERLEELKKIPVIEAILHPEPISNWVSAIYSTGLQHARKQEWAEAAKSFRRTLEDDRHFLDAHLWLARLSLTEKEMRDHLSSVLAMMPHHAEAMVRMMVLNRQMTSDEASRALNPNAVPQTQVASSPVATTAKLMKCPNCGGRMRAGDDARSVVCEFCGHTEGRGMGQDTGLKSFSMAMLKQRGQQVQWVVGDRLLKCQTCGAERTMKHGAMSERCVFCGSSYVVQTDALGSFQQPDGMIRFEVKQSQALAAVQQALKSTVERVKGWFSNNEAGRITLETMYLPFWVFDFTLEVKKTLTRTSGQRSRYSNDTAAVRYETFAEMANDVPVIGSKEIDPKLIGGTGRFMFDQIKPYHPDLLASHSAMIYHLPFDKAALDARQGVSEHMRTIHGQGLNGEEVRVSVLFQQIMFRLVLLPFWVVTILEQDGDIRPALVNGQTGAVALGKARKPKG